MNVDTEKERNKRKKKSGKFKKMRTKIKLKWTETRQQKELKIFSNLEKTEYFTITLSRPTTGVSSVQKSDVSVSHHQGMTP
jgi:hypothetical protein